MIFEYFEYIFMFLVGVLFVSSLFATPYFLEKIYNILKKHFNENSED